MRRYRNRPLIGITTSARSGWRIFPAIALSVLLAGGRAVWWRVGRPASIRDVDGLIVGGGDDISADLYGGRLMPEARVDPERDALERRLVRDARTLRRPVLGICRGAQMMNVALGGSLHQDIYAVYADARRHWTVLPRKTVRVVGGTYLARISGPDEMRVNALHTQSVADLGRGLRIAAREPSGVVQAVECTGDDFYLGVQWHPEHLIYARRQRRIFQALVEAARARAEHRAQAQAVDEMEPL
ncbi:gamma-glutamyl-gamma-aminobutyrate hydrolase family protein [Rhodobacteraceae bacterium 2CG4]|uniref:Gamma-glutamyl-gamma-aminobutyrate hydrolase family protein n=1 Tax=Halovulum marinum TaxID=2662447 RepID=A0A6L5Z1T9_9RHOB|nr:gamma-glutamyl-gamma-aminobutyrate hydrolase family protein [Halovulum marinum]